VRTKLTIDRNIHIWSVDLDRNRHRVNGLREVLTESERQRAAKLINPVQRDS
jgi:hypothetical protein